MSMTLFLNPNLTQQQAMDLYERRVQTGAEQIAKTVTWATELRAHLCERHRARIQAIRAGEYPATEADELRMHHQAMREVDEMEGALMGLGMMTILC